MAGLARGGRREIGRKRSRNDKYSRIGVVRALARNYVRAYDTGHPSPLFAHARMEVGMR